MSGQMTKKTQLIIPEVLSDMVSAGLPKAIKFTAIAKVDDTLQGIPGDEVTIPKYGYIGDATDVEEGAEIPISQMSTTTDKMKVKKTGKGVELTKEALISAYGDPQGEAVRQLVMAIASKMDEDVVAALGSAALKLDKQTEYISYAGIVDGVDKLAEEESTEKFIFVHPAQVTTLRKSSDFIDKTKYSNEVMMTGEIGMICGCRVVVSRRVPDVSNMYKNYIVALTPEIEDGTPALPPVTIYMKKNVEVESDKDISNGTTLIVATQHYGVKLTNDSKVVEVKFKK